MDRATTSGDKLLALAKRYRQVCFIGRGNYRDDKEAYIFEYWRNPSGINSPIPDSEDDCSSYDRNNLQVNDMGGGYGWRVKDDDHVLQIFDNESTHATARSCSPSTTRSATSSPRRRTASRRRSRTPEFKEGHLVNAWRCTRCPS